MKQIIKIIVCLALLVAALPARGSGHDVKSKPVGEDVVRQAVLATVRIISGSTAADSDEFRGESVGSGVIISADGLVLTARHVVFDKNRPAREIRAALADARNPRMPPNRIKQLKIVAEDVASDLALLRIESKRRNDKPDSFPFLRLAADDDLTFGSQLRLIGFPEAGGVTTTVANATVIGFDARQGWIKVEASMMHGASGGAAINERGELVGIANSVAADRVPLFGDDDLPIGSVTLGKVGFIRDAARIAAFLEKHRTITAGALQASAPGILLSGSVTDAKSGAYLPNASIGVISPQAAAPESFVAPNEWLAIGRTSAAGEFTLNRTVKPGSYLVKVVHADYKPFLRKLEIGREPKSFEIKLTRE